MARSPEWISDVRFYSTESTGRGPEARGSFTVADAVYIQFVVWSNQDGSFQIQLPRVENPKYDSSRDSSKDNRKYFEEVGCRSKEIREEMNRYIVEKLLEARAGSASGSDDDDGSPIPF